MASSSTATCCTAQTKIVRKITAGLCSAATTPRATTPFLAHHHPFYTPLDKVDDGAIKRASVKFASGIDGFREKSANLPELNRTIR